jgi:hypothetical protein
MKRFLTASAAALVALLLTSSFSHAGVVDPTNVQWTYNFMPGAPAVLADGNPAAGVTFTNEPTGHAVGNSDIVATNLRVFSAAPGTSPDMLTGNNGNYSLALGLSTTDSTGNTVNGTLTFHGTLSGSFSSQNSNVNNQFGSDSSQQVSLGDFTFTVTLSSYTPPGPPDQTNAGSISAFVEVSSITTAQVPEPAAVVLSCLGGLSFLGAAWRRRNRSRN